MTKVKLPREVAEAIEFMREHGTSDYELIKRLASSQDTEGHSQVLRGWALCQNGGTSDLLMQALVIGYEVEKTPEERVKDKYAQILTWKRAHHKDGEYGAADGREDGFRMALEALGIKISGVNAI